MFSTFTRNLVLYQLDIKTTIKGSKSCYTDCRVGGLEEVEVEVEVEGVYYCSDTSRSAVVPSYSSDREGFQFVLLTNNNHRDGGPRSHELHGQGLCRRSSSLSLSLSD